jgi:hypothetical protein
VVQKIIPCNGMECGIRENLWNRNGMKVVESLWNGMKVVGSLWSGME